MRHVLLAAALLLAGAGARTGAEPTPQELPIVVLDGDVFTVDPASGVLAPYTGITGSGTASDPYRIENRSFDGRRWNSFSPLAPAAIYIQDSHAHVIIRNNHFEYWPSAAVWIRRSSNVTVDANSIVLGHPLALGPAGVLVDDGSVRVRMVFPGGACITDSSQQCTHPFLLLADWARPVGGDDPPLRLSTDVRIERNAVTTSALRESAVGIWLAGVGAGVAVASNHLNLSYGSGELYGIRVDPGSAAGPASTLQLSGNRIALAAAGNENLRGIAAVLRTNQALASDSEDITLTGPTGATGTWYGLTAATGSAATVDRLVVRGGTTCAAFTSVSSVRLLSGQLVNCRQRGLLLVFVPQATVALATLSGTGDGIVLGAGSSSLNVQASVVNVGSAAVRDVLGGSGLLKVTSTSLTGDAALVSSRAPAGRAIIIHGGTITGDVRVSANSLEIRPGTTVDAPAFLVDAGASFVGSGITLNSANATFGPGQAGLIDATVTAPITWRPATTGTIVRTLVQGSIVTSGNHDLDLVDSTIRGPATCLDVRGDGTSAERVTLECTLGLNATGPATVYGKNVTFLGAEAARVGPDALVTILGSRIEAAGGVTTEGGALDARNNWWGAADGPSGIGTGSGVPLTIVGGTAAYEPFLPSPPPAGAP